MTAVNELASIEEVVNALYQVQLSREEGSWNSSRSLQNSITIMESLEPGDPARVTALALQASETLALITRTLDAANGRPVHEYHFQHLSTPVSLLLQHLVSMADALVYGPAAKHGEYIANIAYFDDPQAPIPFWAEQLTLAFEGHTSADLECYRPEDVMLWALKLNTLVYELIAHYTSPVTLEVLDTCPPVCECHQVESEIFMTALISAIAFGAAWLVVIQRGLDHDIVTTYNRQFLPTNFE